MEKVFDTIFDAIRHLAPGSPLIQLASDKGYFFRRTDQYQIIDMQNGYFSAFPGFSITLYRGEYKDYGTCKASIYRSEDPDDIIIDELRILEFKNILKTFPQVKYSIEDQMKVDFLALAQHYGLNTNLIDLSSEPEIAAYFATHSWKEGVATPVNDGIGCIHSMVSPGLLNPGWMFEKNPRFHMIGLQCFKRPGLQAAYGFELDKNEDLRGKCSTVYFRQNPEATRLIHMNFHLDENKVEEIHKTENLGIAFNPDKLLSENSWLFPDEDIIEVATIVRKSKRLSRETIEEYGKPCEDVLKRKEIEISEEPIYALSEARVKELEEKYKGRPYGNVSLRSSLVCRPLSDR